MEPISKKMSIKKFNINEKPIYVKVLWKQNDSDFLHIKIFDGDGTWSGRMSNEFATKYRERFDETEEQYFISVLEGLKGSGHDGFAYDFKISSEDSNSACFTWKKRFEDSQHALAFLVHGSVPVNRDTTAESKDSLLDFLLEENAELSATIDNLKGKNELMISDLQKCKLELEKFVNIKTNLEASLYGKFVQLLNAKKRRMLLLKSNIPKFSGPTEISSAGHKIIGETNQEEMS